MAAPTMAKAIPVLPDVASTRVSPGRISPRCSACSTIDSARRSLTDERGLKYSALTYLGEARRVSWE